MKSYLTGHERAQFKAMRKTGEMSFFRLDWCPCGEEIPKGKAYCSWKCYREAEGDVGEIGEDDQGRLD